MLTSIFHAGTFRLEAVAAAMAAALILGIIIASLYRITGIHISSFVVILAVMPLLVTTVIMIVNGNLGTSVAVLGAFGLVRFRSAPGSAKEIGFIFFAMAVGLAIGMGFLSLAVLLTIVIGITMIILEKAHFGNDTSSERELRITIPEDMNYTGIFDDLFQVYTKTSHLERVKTTNMGTMYELSYRVELRNMEKEKEFIDALRCRNGNLSIILGLVQREKNEL
ncbi:DUF4956 domain-containing protein [Parablautia sp. Marseille-Q6255]|uniref:DUF4956 domain-containing protein n=1 Tax=Parablautia sp. Marseille-Q6255 TaxID=3039593 RepID=UPI0024BCCDC2|nr:DUF4956 domain-containing protein [Parablautia sp. Marseille-Q6255]